MKNSSRLKQRSWHARRRVSSPISSMLWRSSRTEEMENRTTLHQLSLTRGLMLLTVALISSFKEALPMKSQMKVDQAKASGWFRPSSLKVCKSRCQSLFRRPRLFKQWVRTRCLLAPIWLRVQTRRSLTWTVNLHEFPTQALEAPKVPRATAAATALRLRKRYLAAFPTTLIKTNKNKLKIKTVKIRRKKVDQTRLKTAAKWTPSQAQRASRT